MRSDIRLAVIPPGPVSDRTKVEMRAAVANPTDRPRDIEVEFLCDDEVIERVTVSVPANAEDVARAWVSTRRRAGEHVLTARAADTKQATRPFHVEASTTRALKRLSAAWLDPGSFEPTRGYPRAATAEPDDIREVVAAIDDLGMNTIVLTYLEYSGAVYYPTQLSFYDRDIKAWVGPQTFPFDFPETVLDEADRRGMYVFLGLGRGGDTPLLWEFDNDDWHDRNVSGIEHTNRVASELWRLYGHHASLYGWYLTHEMNDLARASAYYDPVARHCRTLAPEKPILAAPSGTPIVDGATLRASEVDIFAYQDAVGAGYLPYEYTWDPQRRIATLHDVYASYAAAHEGSGKHLWSDLEIWEMDGATGYNGSYAPKISRVIEQIEAEAPHVDWVTAYEFSGFMERPGAHAGLIDPRARSLYDDYRAFLKGHER